TFDKDAEGPARLDSGDGWAEPGVIHLGVGFLAWEDAESYPDGPIAAPDAGGGWDGEGLILSPFLGLTAVEDFDDYPIGRIWWFTLGRGWAAAMWLRGPLIMIAAFETFQELSLGAVSSLPGGEGWSRPGTLTTP
ncbi:MAG: hypothetical protein NZP34_13480, partial [Caldilineales bacterium]|nr:hypothetical protein [Caldilineales bacterium]